MSDHGRVTLIEISTTVTSLTREQQVEANLRSLRHPPAIIDPVELLNGRAHPPDGEGIEAWYFKTLPPGIPEADYINTGSFRLLYIGIAADLRNRVLRCHLQGVAANSTLRMNLGCLMADTLGLRPEPFEDRGVWFGPEGERALTNWLLANTRVAWLRDEHAIDIEVAAFQKFGHLLPLNTRGNNANPLLSELLRLRDNMRSEGAASLPDPGGSARAKVVASKLEFLTRPSTLHTLAELRDQVDLVPDGSGVYGWYFDHLPSGIPSNGYFEVDGWHLLYVGISDNLRRRLIMMHMRGSSDISTLHESLACLLPEGDSVNEWMKQHARIAFVQDDQPEAIENEAIERYGDLLPLNLQKNRKNPFAAELKRLRRKARDAGTSEPPSFDSKTNS